MADLPVAVLHQPVEQLAEAHRHTGAGGPLQDLAQRRVEPGGAGQVVALAAEDQVRMASKPSSPASASTGTSRRTNSHQCPSAGRARFLSRSASSGRLAALGVGDDRRAPSSFRDASQRQ